MEPSGRPHDRVERRRDVVGFPRRGLVMDQGRYEGLMPAVVLEGCIRPLVPSQPVAYRR